MHDFSLCTIDCVLDPSIGKFANCNANRFVDGVLESKDFYLKAHPNAQPIFEAIEKNVKTLSVNSVHRNEQIAAAFNTFLNSIRRGIKE